MLRVDNLHKRFGDKPVLDGVSAVFRPGEVVAIVGPNGAGKSTLLSCLAGLLSPDQGRVQFGAEDMAAISDRVRAQRIGFLPQIPEVAWAVDVRTLVGLGRTPFVHGFGLSAEDKAAVTRALAFTGTDDLADRIVTTLSGGERARVLLARVLAGEPQWLLADEPLAGLDPGHQWDAMALLQRLAADGRGIVLTMHDLHAALRLANRVVVLTGGHIIADDAPERAMTPAVMASAYGIDARFSSGIAGPVIEIVGRLG